MCSRILADAGWVNEHFEVRSIPRQRNVIPYGRFRNGCRNSSTPAPRAVADSPARSQWAVGTESNLVNRLARWHGDKYVRVLSGGPASCWQMGKIDLPHLLWALDSLALGKPVNQITVPPDIAADAKIALQRMIDIKAAPNAT